MFEKVATGHYHAIDLIKSQCEQSQIEHSSRGIICRGIERIKLTQDFFILQQGALDDIGWNLYIPTDSAVQSCIQIHRQAISAMEMNE